MRPGGELDRQLTLACRDLWVLMAELATLPENQHKLSMARPGSRPPWSMPSRLGRRPRRPVRGAVAKFVVPGQTPLAAQLDLARTVVRRAEREAVAATAAGSHVLAYLNRLSSLLWVQARWVEGEHLLSRDVAVDDPPGDGG